MLDSMLAIQYCNNNNIQSNSSASNGNNNSYSNNNYNLSSNNSIFSSNNSLVNNPMDESILILPEYQKLEISASGKCEYVTNNITNTMLAHRRRRTSSSNSRKDNTITKYVNGRFVFQRTLFCCSLYNISFLLN